MNTAVSFSPSFTSLRTSWEYVKEGFLPELKLLEEKGLLSETGPGEMIWETKSKYVLKVPLSTGGFAVVKKYRRISKPAKFLLRLSPCGLEACNFGRFEKLAIPLPELLAVGDTRKFFVLKDCFIITGFADGYRDGRDFFGTGILAQDQTLQQEFLRRNLEMLAFCHQHGIWHRGFTPFNLLYKLKDSPDANGNALDIIWIDVASCRKKLFVNPALTAKDIGYLLRYFRFPDEIKMQYLEFYARKRRWSLKRLPQLLTLVNSWK
jgi:hypothetical protein